MIVGIDHIAIAVSDLSLAMKKFCEDLGLDASGTEDVEPMMTRTAFFPLAGQAKVELISPIDNQGPVNKYLDKKGEGLHHICFETDNLSEDVERLRSLGYEFTSDKPSDGAHGHKVIFLHPKSIHGILIELVEKNKIA